MKGTARIRALLAFSFALGLAPALASADGGKRPPDRAVPEYDGRESEGATAGDVLLWVPRVVLFPVRLVVDYGVRRPIGWLVRKAEHSRGFRRFVAGLFREIEEANPLIYPVALVDFGFKSSVGARIVWRRGYLVPKSDVTLRVGTGGLDFWRADAGIKTKVGALRSAAQVGVNNRPDYVFYGIGGDTPDAARARYEARRIFASGSFGGALQDIGAAGLHVGYSDVSFDSSTYSGDHSIEEQVADGRIAMLPPGYIEGIRTLRAGARLTLDTRFDGRRARSGARLDVAIDRVFETEQDNAWTKIDVMIGGGLLLDPVAERKLDIKLGVELVEPDSASTTIPFLELATISNTAWLRGLYTGRVYGESAAALIVDYHWPIAAWLDAHAHVGAGNVFEPRLGGFSLGALRGSFGGALTVAGLSDRQIGVFFAWGTEPFENGFDVSSNRLILEYSGDY